MKISYSFGFLGLVGIMAFANAEQTLEQNPCLYYPDSCKGGGVAQPRRVINIPTHWGAVAIDPNKNIAGTSENLKSERAAKRQAMKDCQNRGGTDCKLWGVSRNSCIAYGLATRQDSTGFIPLKGGSTKQEAETAVVNNCKSRGGVKCQVLYSHCNKDPRYDMY